MIDQIKCPNCGELIPISETLHYQLSEAAREELKQEVVDKQKKLLAKERELNEKAKEIVSAKNNINQLVEEKLKSEKARIEKEAVKKAENSVELELKDLREEMKEKDDKLKESQEAELELRKKTRELEEKGKSLELEITRKLDKEREKIKEDAVKIFSEEHRLKDAEKDKKLQDAIKANEELRRKLQQGSQQTQGEVLELELEELLKTNFPLDAIEPVPKGIRGADVLQKVYNQSGQLCGMIVWESKHTKAWSNGWVPKLKDDQREIKADIAILITEALPKDVNNFAHKNGIWITNHGSILGLATAIRLNLVQVAVTKLSVVGKNEKMEVVYNYLSGPEFRQRVEAIVEAFVTMQQDLNDEKRASIKRWAKREKQIERIINNTAGMYGDMQGLIGSAMQSIPALESGTEKEETVEINKANNESTIKEIPF